MPRSVRHTVEGGELRVYHNSKTDRHVVMYEGARDGYDVESRWEVARGARPWFDLAEGARTGDNDAALELAEAMVKEAVEEPA